MQVGGRRLAQRLPANLRIRNLGLTNQSLVMTKSYKQFHKVAYSLAETIRFQLGVKRKDFHIHWELTGGGDYPDWPVVRLYFEVPLGKLSAAGLESVLGAYRLLQNPSQYCIVEAPDTTIYIDPDE